MSLAGGLGRQGAGMSRRRFATFVAALGAGGVLAGGALAGWAVSGFAGLDLPAVAHDASANAPVPALSVVDRREKSERLSSAPLGELIPSQVTASETTVPQATAPLVIAMASVPDADVAPAAEPTPAIPPSAAARIDEAHPIVEAALPDEAAPPSAEEAAAEAEVAAPAEPVKVEIAANSTEIFDECPAAEVCIDRYLWVLYQRTPKVDTVKVTDKKKVTIKKGGKTRTVTKSITRLVTENFAWKDPKAAEKVNMPLQEYVIGGMDRSFKLKLFNLLRALDEAGFKPGITSAFRDDYRQGIATGMKASSNSSYHGGSLRGGYGHGLAADLVSVRGRTRLERMTSSDLLWKWIDENGKSYGIGRPYLDRDPPHVGPIEGKEYASKRGTGAKTQVAAKAGKKNHRLAANTGKVIAKHAGAAKLAKAGIAAHGPQHKLRTATIRAGQ
jgi:hypothetical protein